VALAVAALVSVPFIVLALLVLGQSEWLQQLDEAVATWFHQRVRFHETTIEALLVIQVVLDPFALRAVAVAVAVWLWRRRDRLAAIWLITTMVVGGILAAVLKVAVQRQRPEFDEPISVALGFSFPSGHALNAMLFAAAMVVLAYPATRGATRAALLGLAAALVLVVAVDRVALGVHYFSDIVAGWTVALATVTATALAFGVTRRPPPAPPRSEPALSKSAPSKEEHLPVSAVTEHSPSNAERPTPQPGWPRTIGHLAVRLVPGWVAIWALLVGLGLLFIGPMADVWPLNVEDEVNTGLEGARTGLWNGITYGMGWMGATAPIVVCAVIAAIVLRVRLRRWAEAVFVLAAPLGQSVVFFFTQLVLERDRPEVERLDDSPPTSSYPSGHTSAAMSLWWGLALICIRVMRPGLRRNVVVIVLALIPLCVITARLYRGMHHPSDVAASLVNAGLILALTDRVVRGTDFPAVKDGRSS
jgi:membrane-associated phospholipid phosphatase